MEKRTLGRTDLPVTVLAYGAMEIRKSQAEGVSDDEAERILNAVLDAGINFIDTAPDYGLSEQRIGKFISNRRTEYYLATKCGCNIDRDPGEPPHVWTRDRLLQNIETSLQRMKTDYVDIWQIHNADPAQVEAGDLLEVMEDVKRQGKVRHVAISSTLPHIDTYITFGAFDSYQIPYSALQREEEDSITRAADAGAGTIIRGGVAQGEPGAGRGSAERWDVWEKTRLDELRDDGESRSAFLLRFTISHPDMHTTIVGTKNPDHLAENIKAIEAGNLPAEVYAEAKKRLS